MIVAIDDLKWWRQYLWSEAVAATKAHENMRRSMILRQINTFDDRNATVLWSD